MKQKSLFPDAGPSRTYVTGPRPGWIASFEWIEEQSQKVIERIDAGEGNLRHLLNWTDFLTERVEHFAEDLDDWLRGRPETKRYPMLNYKSIDEDRPLEERRLPESI